MTKQECLNRALSLSKWEYIYGFKHKDNPVNNSKIDSLRKQYSSVFTNSYYSKALTFAGKNAIDCSGLVCYAWNIADIGSWNIHDLPLTNSDYKLTNIADNMEIGSAVWKTGHCGIYIGDRKVIEARGIDYGVVITDLFSRSWEKAIIPTFEKDIEVDYENLGWNEDTLGWWYATGTKKGDYYKNTITVIDGKSYAFDNEGYLIYGGKFQTGSKGSIISVERGCNNVN